LDGSEWFYLEHSTSLQNEDPDSLIHTYKLFLPQFTQDFTPDFLPKPPQILTTMKNPIQLLTWSNKHQTYLCGNNNFLETYKELPFPVNDAGEYPYYFVGRYTHLNLIPLPAYPDVTEDFQIYNHILHLPPDYGNGLEFQITFTYENQPPLNILHDKAWQTILTFLERAGIQHTIDPKTHTPAIKLENHTFPLKRKDSPPFRRVSFLIFIPELLKS
jgi:hypothetical protein